MLQGGIVERKNLLGYRIRSPPIVQKYMGAGNQTVHRFRYALGYYYTTSCRKLSRKIKPHKRKKAVYFSVRRFFTSSIFGKA